MHMNILRIAVCYFHTLVVRTCVQDHNFKGIPGRRFQTALQGICRIFRHNTKADRDVHHKTSQSIISTSL